MIKKYKPPIKRKICTLVKSFVFINQSEWAITNILIIKITIVKPAIRVIKFPYGFLINPPIIKAAPTETSVIATNDAILVVPKDKAEQVKNVVDYLEKNNKNELL